MPVPVVHRVGKLGVAMVAVLLSPGTATAQDSATPRNHLYDTFQASLDVTTVLNRSSARVDPSNGGLGTDLDFQSILGISTTSLQPALGVRWRPGRRTEFEAGYQFLNQTGQRAFQDSLLIGDDTLAGNLALHTTAGASNATLQFRYAIWAAERHKVGAALGLGAVFLALDFEGTADGTCAGPGCDPGGSGAYMSSKRFTAPTGSLGAFGGWRLGDRWYLGGDARAIAGKVDRYDIGVFEGDVRAEYYLSDHWGLEAGVFYTNVRVDVAPKSEPDPEDLTHFTGSIDYNYTSLRLGVIGVF